MAFEWLEDIGNTLNPFDDYDSEKEASKAPIADEKNYRLSGDGGISGRQMFELYGTMGNEARNREAFQADYGAANAQYGTAGQVLGADAAVAGNQRGLSGALAARAMGLGGPSLAEMSMQRQSDDIAAQNMAMAASGSGPSNAALLINAQRQNAQAGGQLTRDMGIQRAAEQQAAEAALGQNLQAERAGAVNTAGAYGALGAAQQGQAEYNAGLQAQNRAQNDAQQLGLLDFGYRGYETDAQLRAQMDTNQGNWKVGAASNQIAAQQADNASGAGVTGMVGGMLQSDVRSKTGISPAYDSGGANNFLEEQKRRKAEQDAKSDRAKGNIMKLAMMFSDERAKKNVGSASRQPNPYDAMDAADAEDARYGDAADSPWYKRLGWAMTGNTDAMGRYNAATDAREKAQKARAGYVDSVAGKNPYSDIRSKRSVDPEQPDIGDTFRELGSWGYEYKDPERHGEGRHYGPMAQELARTPAGASTVQRGPDGRLAVDTGRLALVNASETGNLRREVDGLKAAIGDAEGGTIDALRNTDVEYPVEENPYEPRVQPTDLVYDQRTNQFRTPEQQYRYQDALKRASRPDVTPQDRLFVSEDESTFRTPSEQYDYQAKLLRDSGTDREIARLRKQNDETERMLERLRGAERASTAALRQPTAYPGGGSWQ